MPKAAAHAHQGIPLVYMGKIVEQLFGSPSLATCIIDRDRRISRASEAAAAIFGVSALEGLLADDLIPDASPVIRRCFDLAARGAAIPDQHFAANGRRYALSFHAMATGGGELLVIALDMTRRLEVEDLLRASRRRLMAASRRDHLTGLLNRRGLETALHLELRRARRSKTPLSLLVIDIDWFKAYNDNLGHREGDRCLGRVADALLGCLRRAGDVACRYGGEEFVLILPGTNAAGAAIVASNCQRAIEALSIAHPASPLGRITVSVGIVEAEGGALPDAAMLFDQADRALYRAKRNGRNRYELA